MRLGSKATVWLRCVRPRPDAPSLLVCFPHAGRGASLFHPWAASLTDVEIWSVQLPGRENRLGEPPCRSVDAIVESIAESIDAKLDRPFTCFGHSMGALLAFEFARQLRRAGGPLPTRLLVAGFRAPHLPQRHAPMSKESDERFVERLVELDGTPAEVLAHDELRRIVIPALRADFEACETYHYRSEAPLRCDIEAFCSTRDPLVGRAEIAAWRAHATGTFRMHTIEGGHFDLFDRDNPVLLDRIGGTFADDQRLSPDDTRTAAGVR